MPAAALPQDEPVGIATDVSINATPAPQLVLDKSAQRRFGLRTQLAAARAPAITLPAQVIADPRRQVVLTADQAGTLEAPPGGFVDAGSSVRAGQVLALLRPALPEPQRRDLEADLALAERDVELGKIQIKRYGINLAEKFDVKLPTPSLQVVLDYRTAQARAQQYGTALLQLIPLTAPSAGVVQRSLARRGAAVALGQSLFELSLSIPRAVELQFADRGFDAAAATQATTLSGRTLPLAFLGTAYDPALRLQRAYYALSSNDTGLAVGEPLQVRVPPVRAAAGHWLLPALAVVADRGESWVWLHRQAEQFVARPVTVTPMGSGWVEVAGALDDDDRIVVEGAATLQRRARLQSVHS